MAILEMKKIRVLSHRSVGPEVLKVLQEMGVMHLSQGEVSDARLSKITKEASEFDYLSSRLDFAVEFLSKYRKDSFLRNLFEGGRVPTTEEGMNKLAESFYYKEVIDNIFNLEEGINERENRIKKLEEEEEILKEWQGLGITLAEASPTETTKIAFLAGEEKELGELEEELKKGLEESFVLNRVSPSRAFLVYFNSDEEVVKKAISSFKVEEVALPKRRGTPEEELERIERAKESARKELGELEKEALELSEHLPKIKILSDYMRWKKERNDLMYESYGTENFLFLEGWVASKSLPILEDQLKGTTPLAEVEVLEVDQQSEEVPVEIENKSTVSPFESVTRLYGLPGRKDLDPTPYLAGFFFVFFGICLSDLGYGLVLTSLSAAVLFYYRLDRHFKSFMKLLMAGGISSMVAGILFGGYFGINVSLLPEFIQRLQYFDPIADPLPIFYLALALGVIQIVVGIVLSIAREAKENNLSGGLIANGPWLALFVSLGLWAGEMLEAIPAIGGFSFLYLVYLSLASIVLAGAWQFKGGVISKVLMGVLKLYDSVGFLSDILSFSRLLALGLATSALAFSVNLIGLMVYEGVPYVGWLLMVIVLVVGHFFNFAVNVLSTFIHTARLQFVEFFGKFIVGSGKPFLPFAREERYVFLENELSEKDTVKEP